MPKWLKIDEFHIFVSVPAGRTPSGVQAALTDPRFLSRLGAAVRRAMAEVPALRRVRISVSR